MLFIRVAALVCCTSLLTAENQSSRRVLDLLKVSLGSTLSLLSNSLSTITDISLSAMVLAGHKNALTCAAFGPDENIVAIASFDGTTSLWNTKDGSLIARLNQHTGSLYTIEFSSDGKKLLTASYDGSVKIWDLSTNTVLFSLKNHLYPVHIAHFSPDGKMIATATAHMLYLWDAQTGNLIYSINHAQSSIYDVQFSDNGNSLILALGNGTAEILNTTDGNTSLHLKGHARPLITAIFSNNNQYAITYSWDNFLKIWDAQKGTLIYSTSITANSTYSPALSTDSKNILLIADKKVSVVTIKTGRDLFTLIGHESPIHTAKFSSDGKKILSVDTTTIKVWDASSGILLKTLTDPTMSFKNVYLSNSGNKMLALSESTTAKLWTSLLSLLT